MRYDAPLSSSAAFLSNSAIQAIGSGSVPFPPQLLPTIRNRIKSQPPPLLTPAPTLAGDDPGQEDLQEAEEELAAAKRAAAIAKVSDHSPVDILG